MTDLLEQAQEKLQELIDIAEDVADETEKYLDVASEIDHRKRVNDPREYVPLDDLPFGEECARLDGAPSALRSLASELAVVPVAQMPLGELIKKIEEAEEQIEEVKSTLGDCTPLPNNNDDDELLP